MRWPTWSELLAASVGGLAVGLTAGFGVGLIAGFGVGLLVWLMVAVAVGFAEHWVTPLSTAHAADPQWVYRIDRRRTLILVLMAGLSYGLWAGIVAGFLAGLEVGFTAALLAGLVVWVVAGLILGLGPALLLTMGQLTLWLHGRGVQFMPLLQTALHRQVLRQAGAVYQFRHAALQDFLKTR